MNKYSHNRAGSTVKAPPIKLVVWGAIALGVLALPFAQRSYREWDIKRMMDSARMHLQQHQLEEALHLLVQVDTADYSVDDLQALLLETRAKLALENASAGNASKAFALCDAAYGRPEKSQLGQQTKEELLVEINARLGAYFESVSKLKDAYKCFLAAGSFKDAFRISVSANDFISAADILRKHANGLSVPRERACSVYFEAAKAEFQNGQTSKALILFGLSEKKDATIDYLLENGAAAIALPMINREADLGRFAQAAVLAKDWLGAGQAFESNKQQDKALQIYTEHGLHRQAARLLSKLGRLDEAAVAYAAEGPSSEAVSWLTKYGYASQVRTIILGVLSNGRPEEAHALAVNLPRNQIDTILGELHHTQGQISVETKARFLSMMGFRQKAAKIRLDSGDFPGALAELEADESLPDFYAELCQKILRSGDTPSIISCIMLTHKRKLVGELDLLRPAGLGIIRNCTDEGIIENMGLALSSYDVCIQRIREMLPDLNADRLAFSKLVHAAEVSLPALERLVRYTDYTDRSQTSSVVSAYNDELQKLIKNWPRVDMQKSSMTTMLGSVNDVTNYSFAVNSSFGRALASGVLRVVLYKASKDDLEFRHLYQSSTKATKASPDFEATIPLERISPGGSIVMRGTLRGLLGYSTWNCSVSEVVLEPNKTESIPPSPGQL